MQGAMRALFLIYVLQMDSTALLIPLHEQSWPHSVAIASRKLTGMKFEISSLGQMLSHQDELPLTALPLGTPETSQYTRRVCAK